MIFTYSVWEQFCKELSNKNIKSITAESLMDQKPLGNYLVLKHDVETNVASAYNMAKIEHKYGHKASYYVQAYLMENSDNIIMLKKMQDLGHEISYHYDVMDSNKGNIKEAIAEFNEKRKLFENNGFRLETVCQHGNPVVERIGYTSNRDFFRNEKVKSCYPDIADIMVDFKEKAFGSTDYLYFSDAGRRFKLIFDPINNDIIPSDDKNIPFDNLQSLLNYVLTEDKNCIISTHPHRWVKSKVLYIIKNIIFKIIRFVAKITSKIPFFKKIMSRYYYLAKKI